MGTRHVASALATNDAGNWTQAHAALSRLARERAALDVEEGHWLLRALRSSAHVHLGYGSFAQYIERLFGYRPRTTQEKLRVAEALEMLPGVSRALQSGDLSWCAARELTRVMVPDTEGAWLHAARGRTLREIEALVSNKATGEAPDTPATELPRSRVLRFEVAADTFATFRQAMQRLQRSAGGSLDDDAILLAMARHILGEPKDDGRSSYQISFSLCGACGHGAQAAGGELVPIDAAVVAMAACDAQHLGELLPHAAALPAANANAADSNDYQNVGTLQSSDHAHVGVDSQKADAAATTASDTTDATPSKQAGRVGARASVDVGPRRRAKQSVPPALRRAVLMRDGRRCRAPGCSHATFLDVHHIQPRSEGGRNEAINLLTLCPAHHRAAHRGDLLIERDPEGALTFRHADGGAYGSPVSPLVVDAHAKVFSALRNLGFREFEVKSVLAELRGDAQLCGAPVERLLREALCRIRSAVR